jgi:N-acylglucosamine 2-epimerase
MLDQEKVADLARFYRQHLLVDVMPFWEARTRDTEHGGYLTCFDRVGNVTDTDKYIWFQGRQVWTFSALYNRVERRAGWLDLARHGRDFLVRHAYAGQGRWHFHLDRQGKVKKGTISVFSDYFVLAGLCEYAIASGSDEDMALIRETYDAIERSVHDRNFKDIYLNTWSPRYKRHGTYLISLHVADIAERVLGQKRTRPLIDHCLQEVLYAFARDDRRLLFESVGRDGQLIDGPEGRVLNPGHALESMWFCMAEGKKRGDRTVIARAIEIAGWMYRRGYDREHGGILYTLDAGGEEPQGEGIWHWDDKVWWVQCEALCALAFAAVETGSDEWFGRFLNLHAWCQAHLYDPEYGEWYSDLWRDGKPKHTDKGTMWKAAYHLPRTLMVVSDLFAHYLR